MADRDRVVQAVRTSPIVKDRPKDVSFPKEEEEKEEIAEGDIGESEEQNSEQPDPPRKPLYKSSRFKGYLTLVVGSGVNFQAAYASNQSSFFGDIVVVRATDRQRNYAMAVGLLSMLICSSIIIAHLDVCSPMKKYWQRIYQAKSRMELFLISFLLIWWAVALWINTGLSGIAGDGKGQYNFYFSSWICFFICAWTLERWMVACEYASLDSFLASWPNRAAGWIAMFFLSLAALLSIIDLFVNWKLSGVDFIKAHYSEISTAQWDWFLFVTAFTMVPSAGFVLAEIFRENKPGVDKNTKTEWETVLEGFCLLVLVLAWIPSIIVATTPGGAASLVGNAYFFVWGTCVFVVDTSVWWIHDWRRRALAAIQEEEKEYHNIQREVRERSRQEAEKAEAEARPIRDVEDRDDDDMSINSDSIDGQAIPDAAGT